MSWNRLAAAAAVAASQFLLALHPGGPVAAQEPDRGPEPVDCRAEFKRAIKHFDRRDWEGVIEPMIRALDRECTHETVVIPYGRWRYEFTPAAYLGVALSHCAECQEEGRGSGSGARESARFADALSCPVEVEPGSDRSVLLGAGCAACRADGEGDPLSCPLAVDWWLRMASKKEQIGEKLANQGDEDGGYLDECNEVVSVFTQVFRGRDSRILACRSMAKGLRQLWSQCAEPVLEGLEAPSTSCPGRFCGP